MTNKYLPPTQRKRGGHAHHILRNQGIVSCLERKDDKTKQKNKKKKVGKLVNCHCLRNIFQMVDVLESTQL